MPCVKIKYDSPALAYAAARVHRTKKKPRAYRCPYCKKFHLTSNPLDRGAA